MSDYIDKEISENRRIEYERLKEEIRKIKEVAPRRIETVTEENGRLKSLITELADALDQRWCAPDVKELLQKAREAVGK
jgi:hypothetical protein